MSKAAPPGGFPIMSSRDFLIGAAWAVAAAALHAMMPISVRLLSGDMPTIEIVFFRNAMGLAFFFCYFAWRGFGALSTPRFSLHLQRNICNFVGMWLWFSALAAMPVAKAVALHFTEPLMATLLAMLFLGEAPALRRWLAVGAGFVGVLIVLRPGTIPISLPALMVLGSALLYAGVVIYSRILGRFDSPAVTTFYYQLMLTLFSLPFLVVADWVIPTWANLPGLLLLGIAGTAAPYCIIRAFKYAEASAVTPFNFLRLPITAGAAFLLFDEPTEFWTWVGAGMIFAAAYFMTRAEHRAVDVATKR
jgi:drug/metabolite transporter (DMT)-like permease